LGTSFFDRFSRLRIFLPVLKYGSAFAGTNTAAPDRGLRPLRALYRFVEKKCPEASQLYAVSLSERPGDLLKDSIDDLLDISLIEMRVPSPEAQYQLGLDHGAP
jgi:hypothetical protein